MLENKAYNDFLKDMRSVACFDWPGSMFQSLATLFVSFQDSLIFILRLSRQSIVRIFLFSPE